MPRSQRVTTPDTAHDQLPRKVPGQRSSRRGAGWAEVARRLTPRDRWLIRMLHEHAILTTPQLVALGFASLRMTQMRLRALHKMDVTDRVQPFTATGRLPLHHILGPTGARVIAAEEDIPLSQLGWRHDRALAAAHSHTLAHDRATHDLVCALATTPAITLTRWWSATRCARYFGHHTRPDAYLTLTLNPPPPARWHHPPFVAAHPAGVGAWWEAFLEYDTGTEALAVLANKIHGYHRLAAATGITTPVLIYTARPGREPGARAALAHTLHTLPNPALVPIATATPHSTSAGVAAGVAAGVSAQAASGRWWLPLTLHPRPENTRLPRLTLAELATVIRPHPHPGPASNHHLLDPRRHTLTDPTDPRARPTPYGDADLLNGDVLPPGVPLDMPHVEIGDGTRHNIAGAVGVVDLPAPSPLPPPATPSAPASVPRESAGRSGRRR